MREFEKTQWHPPFCSAMKLELRANKEDLSFDIERTLNTKPIRIDLLIVKKTQDVRIENEIGKMLIRYYNWCFRKIEKFLKS